MPPRPTGQPLPPAKWVGTSQSPGGTWEVQCQIAFPEGRIRELHGGRKYENVRIYAFETQAEAAAASDLLSMWRQRLVLGKPLEARNYNLGLARYSEHQAALLACPTTSAARQHVVQLKDNGTLRSLSAGAGGGLGGPPAAAARPGGAAGAAPPPGIGATGGAAGEPPGLAQGDGGGAERGKRKRAQRQPWASEGGSSGEEELSSEEEEEEEEESVELYQQSREGGGSEEGSSDEEEDHRTGRQWWPVPGQPGRWQLHRGGAGDSEDSEHESISDEEQESDHRQAQPTKRPRQQAGPARGGGRGRGRGGRLPGGVAGTGYHSILKAGKRWTSQVALNPTAMLTKFKQDGPANNTALRVTGFKAAAEAAVAADLCLLWRGMASGKSEALVALNHPRQLYEQGPGGRLLASVKAQTDYMVLKAVLHKARDDGSIAALAAGAAAANPPAPVQVAPGAAAQPEAQVQLQQPQQPLAPLPPAQRRTAAAPQPAAGVPPGGSPAHAAAGAAVASPPAAAAAAALAALAAAPVSGEQMVWVLEDALRRTPGLMDRDIAAFMGRFICLPDLRRALFDTVMRHHRAGRHDLVQALSWSFICA